MSISSKRREFLLGLGAWGAVQTLQACSTPPSSLSPQSPLPVQPSWDVIQQPEITQVRLGYLPTAAAAPLIVAQHLNFFTRYGMTEVQLVPWSSWTDWAVAVAGYDDKSPMVDGATAGGHCFSPLPELLTEGLLGINANTKDLEIATDSANPDVMRQDKCPMYVLARLHTQGGAILMHPRYRPLINLPYQRPWRPTFQLSRLLGNILRCGVLSALSPEMLWLRYWLASGNVNPLQDVQLGTMSFKETAKIFTEQPSDLKTADLKTADLISIPPLFPQMVDDRGLIAITTASLWANHPGDIFALRADWVDRYPNATQGLLHGLLTAQNWCDDPQNRRRLQRILQMYLPIYAGSDNVELKEINRKPDTNNPETNKPEPKKPDINKSELNSSLGEIRYWSYEGKTVSYPYKSHDLWFLLEHARWGNLSKELEYKPIIDMVNREDLWRSAARTLGIPDTLMPAGPSRGVEQFFDGTTFNPGFSGEFGADSLKG
jgi:ABC-type nitrate/sulfonate/bicarbonate transport system substrate-binding protein